MDVSNTPDAPVLALQALVWILGDPRRAARLLAMTGLDAATLRSSAASPATQRAILEFLTAHEPDLIACAEAIGCRPEMLVAAARAL